MGRILILLMFLFSYECIFVLYQKMGKKKRGKKNNLLARIKISVNTNISIIGFYENIGNIINIGKISVNIFTKISVRLKFFIF